MTRARDYGGSMRAALRGFTLVEALIALAVFGVIALLAYRATASLSEGEARLSAESQRWRTFEALFTRFEADIRQAIPREARNGGAREPAWIGTTFEGHAALAFTRAGSEFYVEPGAGGQRLGYRQNGNTLELAYWPAIDRDDGARPAIYPLVGGIAAFDLAYLTRAGQWRDRWPLLGEDALPRAVKLALTLDDGTRIERLFTLR
ncbi:MAG: type II secretion system minor pseudopilin GspJ [Burkholderiales bacterium]